MKKKQKKKHEQLRIIVNYSLFTAGVFRWQSSFDKHVVFLFFKQHVMISRTWENHQIYFLKITGNHCPRDYLKI